MGKAFVTSISLSILPTSTDVIEAPLGKKAICTMASGELPSELRFFLYAKEMDNGIIFLSQANIQKDGKEKFDLILTVKSFGIGNSHDMEKVLGFVDIIKGALFSFI